MSAASDMLAAFHARLPEHDERGVRLRLFWEEAGELELALEELQRDEGRERMEAVARELADVVFVCYGTALVYGIDLDAALAAVAEANLRKLDSPKLDRHGKAQKPAGWQPPDMSKALR